MPIKMLIVFLVGFLLSFFAPSLSEASTIIEDLRKIPELAKVPELELSTHVKILTNVGADPIKMAKSYPGFYSKSPTDLEERIKWLSSSGVTDLGILIDGFPKIFQFEFSTLQPVWSHLVQVWGATPASISEASDILGVPFDRVQLMAHVLKLKAIQIKDIPWERRLELIRKHPAEEAYENIDKVVPVAWRARESEDLADEKVTWLATVGVEDADKVYKAARGMFRGNLGLLKSKVAWLRGKKIDPIGPVITEYPEIMMLVEAKYRRLFEWVAGTEETVDLKIVLERLSQIKPIANLLEKIGVSDPLRVLAIEPALIQMLPTLLQKKFDWFEKKGISNVARLVMDSPQTFLLDLDTVLEPGWKLLVDEWGFSAADIEAGHYLRSDFQQLGKIVETLKQMNLRPKGQSLHHRRELMLSVQLAEQLEPLLIRFQKGQPVTVYDVLGKKNPRASFAGKVENGKVDKPIVAKSSPVRIRKPTRERVVRASDEKVEWLSAIGVEDAAEVYRASNQIFAAMKLDELKTRGAWLLDRREDAPSVISKHPEILYICEDKYKPLLEWINKIDPELVNTNIVQSKKVFDFLLSVGVSDLELLFRFPKLIYTLRENYEWLQKKRVTNVKDILYNNTEVFLLDLESLLVPRWNHLEGEWNFIERDIESAPYILLLPVDRMQEMAKLLKQVNLEPQSLDILDRKRLLRNANVERLRGIAETFQTTQTPVTVERILSNEAIQKSKTPRTEREPKESEVEKRSPEELKELAFAWLRSVGVADPAALYEKESDLSPDPRIFQERYDWFRKKGVADVTALLLSNPKLFTYNIEGNIEPTWDYLVSEWAFTLADLVEKPGVLFAGLSRVQKVAEAMTELNLPPKEQSLAHRRKAVLRVQERQLKPFLERFKKGEKITIYEFLSNPVPKSIPSKSDQEKIQWLASMGIDKPEKIYRSAQSNFEGDLSELEKRGNWLQKHAPDRTVTLLTKHPEILLICEDRYKELFDWFFESDTQFIFVKVHLAKRVFDFLKSIDVDPIELFIRFRPLANVEDLQEKYEWFQNKGVINIKDILLSYPYTFVPDFKSSVEPKFSYLIDEWGISPIDIGKIYFYSINLSKLQEVAQILNQMGISPKDQTMADRKNLIRNATKEQLQPFLEKFERGEDVTIYEILGKEAPPPPVQIDVEKAKDAIDWLKSIGVEDPLALLARAIELNRPREDLQEKYDRFQKLGVKDVKALLIKSPKAFLLPGDLLEEKWKHLIEDWGFIVADIEASPIYLCYELERTRDVAKALNQIDIPPQSQPMIHRMRAIREARMKRMRTLIDRFRKGEKVTIEDVFGNAKPEALTPTEIEKIEWLKTLGVRSAPRLYELDREFFEEDISILKEKVLWLQQQGAENIGLLITKHPDIFLICDDRYKDFLKWIYETFASLTMVSFEDAKIMFDWLQKIGVSEPIAFLTRAPQFIFSPDRMQQKFEWYQQKGILNTTEFLLRSPKIFTQGIENNIEPTWLHLEEDWGFTVSDFEANPFDLLNPLQRLKEIALILEEMNFSPKKLSIQDRRRLINKKVEQLKLHLERFRGGAHVTLLEVVSDKITEFVADPSYTEKVEWLITFGLDGPATILSNPEILENDLGLLKARLELLENFGTKNIREIVKEHPGILATPESDFSIRIEYLQKLGADIGQVTERFPVYFYTNFDKVVARVDWIINHGIRNIGQFISRWPDPLGMDIEKLNITWKLLTQDWGGSSAEIEDQGYLFNVSLPRVKALTASAKAAKIDVKRLPWSRRVQILFNYTAGKMSEDEAMSALRSYSEDPRLLMSPEEVRVATKWLKGNGIKDLQSVISKKPKILLLNQPPYKDLREWLSEIGVDNPMKLISNELDFFLDQSPDVIKSRYKDVMSLAVDHRTISEVQYLKSQGFENISELITKYSDRVMRLGTADYRGLVDWLRDMGIQNPIDFIVKNMDFFLEHPLYLLKQDPKKVMELASKEYGGSGGSSAGGKCQSLWE